MVYKGRILGVGLTEEGNPAAIYGLTGRSPPSKARNAKINDNGSVTIGPSGELTEDQKKNAHLLLYNAILTVWDINLPYLVISNGVQTDTIANVSRANPGKYEVIPETLKLFGHEPDSLNTPRIAGELIFSKERAPAGGLGIIVKKPDAFKDDRKYRELAYYKFELSGDCGHGGFATISTYTGENDEKPEAPLLSTIEEIIDDVKLKGNTAQELADSFFESLDEKYRVCTAAAIWKDAHWNLAVKNIHEVI